MKIPQIKTANEILLINQKEYANLLILNGQKIPDPLSSNLNWTILDNSGTSSNNFPQITIDTIKNYFKLKGFTNVGSRKGYEYFASKFIKSIKYCKTPHVFFIQADCIPSQRINDTPHNIWIAFSLDECIARAYCSCTAGWVKYYIFIFVISNILVTFLRTSSLQ